jgi:lipopolysaccharide export system permease protein
MFPPYNNGFNKGHGLFRRQNALRVPIFIPLPYVILTTKIHERVKVKTVYRYILMEMLPSFLLCVAMLTFLFMINKVFLLLDLVINKKVPFWDTMLLYSSILPFILSLTIPMSMMVGTLLAFGRLSSDMEITAFKSSGVHLFRLIAPVLAVGIAMTVLMLIFNDTILPASNFAFKKTQFKILQRQADVTIKERVFIDRFEGYKFFIDRRGPGGLFSDVKVFNRWSSRTPLQTTLAETGRLETDPKTYQVFFHLNNGVMTWDNENYHTFNRLYFDRYSIRLKLENQLARMSDVKKDFQEMNLHELKAEMNRTSDRERWNHVRTEFHKRLSLPFACLVLSWFCAPLGLWTRSKGFMGFVLGLVMIFVYYLMFILGQILSQRGDVHPFLGLWWANFTLAFLGCLLYALVVSEKSFFKFFRFPWNRGKS